MSIKEHALKGVSLTLLAGLIAASPLGFPPDLEEGLYPQVAKAFAKDGDRDDRDDDDDDDDRSGSGGRSGESKSDSDRGKSDRSSSRDSADKARSARDDAADKARSSRDDAADRSRSDRDDDDDRSGSDRDDSDDRSGRSDDDDDDDDDRGPGRGRGSDDDDRRDGRGRGTDDDRRDGRSTAARATSDGSGGGLRVVKIERSSSGLEVVYSNGVKEEIENGRYEMKNAAGRTVLERRATQQDVNRIQGNARASGTSVSSSRSTASASASDAGARLPANSRASRIEIVGRNTIEVSYSSGWKEEVENGRYEMKDPANRTVVQRAATNADLERLMGLAGR